MKTTITPGAARHRRFALRLTLRATRVLVAATALAAAMILSACGNSDPLAGDGGCAGDGLIVGSANFPESETVAEHRIHQGHLVRMARGALGPDDIC